MTVNPPALENTIFLSENGIGCGYNTWSWIAVPKPQTPLQGIPRPLVGSSGAGALLQEGLPGGGVCRVTERLTAHVQWCWTSQDEQTEGGAEPSV